PTTRRAQARHPTTRRAQARPTFCLSATQSSTKLQIMGTPANLLYYGDNLDVLRRHIEDESVDLIYLDPPVNSNAYYNVLCAEQSGDNLLKVARGNRNTRRSTLGRKL